MTGRTQSALAVVVLLAGLLATTPQARGGELAVTVDVPVVSQYVWRGIQFDDKPSLQPTFTLDYSPAEKVSLAVTGWWNIALDDHGSDTHEDMLFEQDFTFVATYSPSEGTSWYAGYTYFSNPRSDVEPGVEAWQTDEVFLGVSFTTGVFSHEASLNQDVDKVKGTYLDLSSGPDFELSEAFSLATRLHLGLASGMDPSDDPGSWYTGDGLVDGNVNATLTWSLGEHFAAEASAAVSQRFDDYHDETGEDDLYTYGGVLLRATF